MILNEEERKALLEKLNNPKAVVRCPRCGNTIRYEDDGVSIAVICNTPRCINGGLRGI